MVDRSGTILYWNEVAADFFGYSILEAVGQSLNLIIPQDYQERHWKGFYEAMARGQSRLDGATQNLPVACADGGVHVFSARFLLIRDPHGAAFGGLAVYTRTRGSEPFSPVESH